MKQRLIELLITIIAAFAGIYILHYIFIIFAPFVIALLFATLLEPLVNFLSRRIPIRRTFSVVIVILVVMSVVILLMILGVSRIYVELNKIVQTLPDYETLTNQFQLIDGGWQEFLEVRNVSPTIISGIEQNIQTIFSALRSGMLQLANIALNAVGGFPTTLMIIFFSFIATFFISRDKNKIISNMYQLFPEDWQDQVKKVFAELSQSAVGYIRAQIILITITGVVAFLGLTILGNEYALTVGLMAAVLDLVPIIGPAVIFYPWLIYSALSGEFAFAIGLLIIHLATVASRESLEGKIVGDNLGLHPLATMIALFVGYRLIGVIGFVIGPAVLVIIKSLARTNLLPYWEARR